MTALKSIGSYVMSAHDCAVTMPEDAVVVGAFCDSPGSSTVVIHAMGNVKEPWRRRRFIILQSHSALPEDDPDIAGVSVIFEALQPGGPGGPRFLLEVLDHEYAAEQGAKS